MGGHDLVTPHFLCVLSAIAQPAMSAHPPVISVIACRCDQHALFQIGNDSDLRSSTQLPPSRPSSWSSEMVLFVIPYNYKSNAVGPWC